LGIELGLRNPPEEQQLFARTFIDRANVSVVHGHSSHHAKAIEVYHKRLILYGCGDFLNDYEGIHGYEEYRSDLALMYFVDIEPTTGDLATFEIIPLQIRKLRLDRPSRQDIEWMQQSLQRECLQFETGIKLDQGGWLVLSPSDVQSTRHGRRQSALIQVKALPRFRRLNNFLSCGGKIGETRQ
jgi:hypothetical protein